MKTWTAPHAVGPDGGGLSVDVSVLKGEDSRKALVIVSGTHGPEGFTGSAAQIALLRALSVSTEPLRGNVVFIHAINPYGFAHVSRTTENNVDWNRNFIDWSAAPPGNPHYDELHDVICPPDFEAGTLEVGKAKLDAWLKTHTRPEFVEQATARARSTATLTARKRSTALF